MTDDMEDQPPDRLVFRRPQCDAVWIDYGFVGASVERVKATAARAFEALNPAPQTKQEAKALAAAAKASGKRLGKLKAEHQAADPLETTISSERIAKPHWAIRLAGVMVGLLGLLLLVPLPIIIAAGVEESLLIDRVTEAPLWALAYGFAPLGAVLAAHGLRDAIKSDRMRRLFDSLVYTATLAAFGAYAWNFGPTFLVDVLFDPSVAAQAGSLAEFYQYHILLEVLGAASAYIASMDLLTSGAKRVSQITEAYETLRAAVFRETLTGLQIARQRDHLAGLPDTYQAALSAFQDEAVLNTEVAAKLFAAQSARESAALRTELHAAFTNPQKGQTDD